MGTFGKAYSLLEKLQNVQQEINQAVPSSPSHSLLLEMGLIQHGSPSDLERYYQAAPRAYMQDPLASEFRAQFLATSNRADLYPVFKAFDGPLYNEQVCLIPWGPSELRKQALLEFPEESSLMGYGWEGKGLSRITMALSWGDLPAAHALAKSQIFPGETPASPHQAMLVGAMVALCRLSAGDSGLNPEDHEKYQWQALAQLEQALLHGAVLDEPCPEIVPMLEFMSDGQEVGLSQNPVGRGRGHDPSYIHPAGSRYDRRPKHVTPAYLARQTISNGLHESPIMSAEVFEALVRKVGTSDFGRKVLTEVACWNFTERFGKAMEGIDLLLDDETDWAWKPGRWSLSQNWAESMPLSQMMLYKKQQHECATDEDIGKWVEGLASGLKGILSSSRRQSAIDTFSAKLKVLEEQLLVWLNPTQKEFVKWSFQSFRDVLAKGVGNGTEQELKAFSLSVDTTPEFAWSQARRGEASGQAQKIRTGPRL